MRLRKVKRRLKDYLLERVTLSLIPNSKGKMWSLPLPRFIFLFFCICLFTYIGVITFSYNDSLERYSQLNEHVLELQAVKTENMSLRTGLAQVAQETEKMRQILMELEEKEENIQSLISDEKQVASTERVKDLILFNYRLLDGDGGSSLGGGGEFLTTDSFDLLTRIREEIRMLRVEIPLQEEMLTELHADVEDYKSLMAATPRGWPVDDQGKSYISSEFGFRKDPFSGENSFHNGLDIGVWYGTPVIATADGTVERANWIGAYGYVVYLKHDYGYQTRYAHNSKLVVRPGQSIKRGDVIAYSGSSGRSEGPHLHYEVRVNGIPENPRKYLKN